MYNIIMAMATLLICWVVANYLAAKCCDGDNENILMVRYALFQTMCLVALISHNLFLK